MRTEGWQSRFWREVDAARERTFAWGTHDCVTFAMACVIAITEDASLEKRIRDAFGHWSDAESAVRAHSGELDTAVCSILGEPVKWVMLQMGDVALAVDDKGREVVCVHDGVKLISPDAKGLQEIPWRCVRHGWRI